MLTLPQGIDPDLLRAFVLIAEGGSVTRAAARVGRTQSAVSMQMRRLEEVLGQPLLTRNGRGLVPTPHGAWLLDRAKRLLAMHDEIVTSFRTPEMSGRVHLGSPDDYALIWLPAILARFAESHPAVEVEVTCAPSTELLQRMQRGELDLTLFSAGNELPGMPPGELLWQGPLRWIGSATHTPHRRLPLPLASASNECVWKSAAIDALDEAGIPWRAAYTSSSQVGTHAVVLAGLAVAVDLGTTLTPGLRLLGPEDGLPPLPEFGIAMMRRAQGPVPEALARHIADSFRREPGGVRPAAELARH
ncbi:LysR family transcriptional regulator [Acetobacteraceae bacterium H6797]|nr:LysR family transcriptional regulator [Acetobacteraceae bacterium H6797]